MRGRGSKELSDPVGQANRGSVIFLTVLLTTKPTLMPDKLAWGDDPPPGLPRWFIGFCTSRNNGSGAKAC
jgi:hypothetical protein